MLNKTISMSLLSATAFSAVANAAEKPNIVIIYADDLGYGDVSCYGAKKINTPHIDKLAKEGMRFTDAHSPSAVCTPSRYGLLTGRYPFKTGINKPVFLKTPLIIETERKTLASLAKDAGYSTAVVGKWHLGFGSKTPTDWNQPLKPGPIELGFDYFFGVPVVNSHPPFVYMENHNVLGLDKSDPFVYGKTAKTQKVHEKMGYREIGGADAAHALYKDEKVGVTLTEKAVNWIKKEKNNPFFLYLATTNIHHPFTPDKQFKGTSEAGVYGDFTHELDWIVGQVNKTLKELNLDKNTLIVFTSDNGGMFNESGQEAWGMGHPINGELLGFKFGSWEGGHRVPFIVKWPGVVQPGSTSNSLVSSLDFFATFQEIFKQAPNKKYGEDSISMMPVLKNAGATYREELLYVPFKFTHIAMRKGDWVYIPAQGDGGFGGKKPGTHVYSGPAALNTTKQKNSDIVNGVYKAGAPKAQLYNLKEDLKQENNVVNDHPEIAKSMSERLKALKGDIKIVETAKAHTVDDKPKGRKKGKKKKLRSH